MWKNQVKMEKKKAGKPIFKRHRDARAISPAPVSRKIKNFLVLHGIVFPKRVIIKARNMAENSGGI